MTEIVSEVEKKGKHNSIYYILSFAMGFLLSFILLWFSPRILGESSVWSTFLYYLTFGMFPVLNSYAYMTAFELAVGIVIGYVAVKSRSYMVLCFALGVGLCPIILAIIGASLPPA